MRISKAIERRTDRFLREPVSIRNAVAVIATATATTVVVAAILMWILDHDEYPTLGGALWWSVQTVTTVGYGDVTPKNAAGRIIGSIVMLEAIAFITVVTAIITSTFVERARREHTDRARRAASPERPAPSVEAELKEIAARLDGIERALANAGQPSAPER